jgi:signal transduction histidine kinase
MNTENKPTPQEVAKIVSEMNSGEKAEFLASLDDETSRNDIRSILAEESDKSDIILKINSALLLIAELARDVDDNASSKLAEHIKNDAGIMEALSRLLRLPISLIDKDPEQIAKLEGAYKFISRIAHDLRSPIAGSYQLAKLYREKIENSENLSSDQLAKLLQILEDHSKRLLQFVENAFTLTKPFKFEQKFIDADELISGILRGFDWSGKNVRTKIEIDPIKLFVDETIFDFQILRNLIKNAYEAMPSNSEKTRTVGIQVKRENGWDTISITDEGPGIPKNICNGLFKQINSSKHGGTGLGLMIVKKMVEMHEGNITFETCCKGENEDDPEKSGTTFTIKIPHKEAV